MHIEVFEGNPFIHLLEEFDLREFARQEKFVKESDWGIRLEYCYQSYL